MSIQPHCEAMVSPAATPNRIRDRVREYYVNTHVDYYRILNAGEHLGFHYGYYDETNRSPNQAILNMNRQLAIRSGIDSSHRILDAGCGIGGSSIWLAQNYQSEVFGLTISETQCEQAKVNASERGVEASTSFFVGDYCSTEFPDNHFDVVWAIESVCYAASKAAFVSEAYRVLKPGGTLIVADGFRTARKLDFPSEILLREWLQGWAVSDVDSSDEMISHCSGIGLADIEFDDITVNVLPFARYLLRLGVMWSPVTHLMRYSGLLGEVRFQNSQSTIRQYRALKAGAWKYGILTARKPRDG